MKIKLYGSEKRRHVYCNKNYMGIIKEAFRNRGLSEYYWANEQYIQFHAENQITKLGIQTEYCIDPTDVRIVDSPNVLSLYVNFVSTTSWVLGKSGEHKRASEILERAFELDQQPPHHTDELVLEFDKETKKPMWMTV